jgi:hypothetical protein
VPDKPRQKAKRKPPELSEAKGQHKLQKMPTIVVVMARLGHTAEMEEMGAHLASD